MLEIPPRSQSFHLTRHGDPTSGTARLCLWGELDLATVPAFRTALDSTPVDARQTLILDLSHLDFLDLHGLRAVLNAHRQQATTQLILGGSPARRLFHLTGNASLLDDPPSSTSHARRTVLEHTA